MLKALAGVALLLVLCGCNNDSDSPDEAGASTGLTVTVIADEGAEPRELSLQCDPAGGDHPQPAEACDAIEAAGLEIFDPVPEDQACTMIFGGPQTATINGTYDGVPVNATFSRQNGCEIDRWDKLGTTVFDVPLQ